MKTLTKTWVPALLAALCVHGSAMAQRYALSPDGTEVSDAVQDLVWRRCPEGRSLVAGQCTAGSTLTFTHEAALLHAATVADSTGLPWRLPNAKELAAIADLSVSKPAIDALAFPNTPLLAFWTSTPQIMHGGTGSALTVDFYQGYLATAARQSLKPVRLVRDKP